MDCLIFFVIWLIWASVINPDLISCRCTSKRLCLIQDILNNLVESSKSFNTGTLSPREFNKKTLEFLSEFRYELERLELDCLDIFINYKDADMLIEDSLKLIRNMHPYPNEKENEATFISVELLTLWQADPFETHAEKMIKFLKKNIVSRLFIRIVK